MNNWTAFGGLVPLWILGAPFIAVLIAHLLSPRPTRRGQQGGADRGLALEREREREREREKWQAQPVAAYPLPAGAPRS